MQFNSRKTIDSKLPGFQDVKFTLDKMTEGRRIKLRLSLADIQDEIRRKMTEASSLKDDDSLSNRTRCGALLDDIRGTVDDQVTPAYVRWGLRSISGLTATPDDSEEFKPCVTADDLITFGPRELYTEIALAIKAEAGLSEQLEGESEPPTTSPAPVERTSNTSAPPVADPALISPATAA